MIIDLHKYLIIGSRNETDRFFDLAQRAGFMEFIGLSHKKAPEMPQAAKTLLSAIKILKPHATSSEEMAPPNLDLVQLAENIIHLNSTLQTLFEEQRVLTAEMARVHPFGDFSREKLDKLE